MSVRLSAVVIALNEEKNIAECLSTLDFCDERVVVDSGSSDRTVEIARKNGAKVFSNPFVDFASQKNFGIKQASGEWILSIDADERVSPKLAAEIKQAVENPAADGYFLPRQNRLFGRWMRHGANRSDFQLRLAKKPHAVFEGKVHERIAVRMRTAKLKQPLLHYSTDTVSQYMNKLNVYTNLEAERMQEAGAGFSEKKIKLKPSAQFFNDFVFKRGFQDGLQGFFFTFFSAYYEFVKLAKLWARESRVFSRGATRTSPPQIIGGSVRRRLADENPAIDAPFGGER